ncbi:MAG TPA: type II secretion system secretin GspD [Deltaproteobacteria bacterium]|jgi:general secretion pathway protein D|nr:type II secretion system secretin GspD [Deltaproteobacteria bacterium]
MPQPQVARPKAPPPESPSASIPDEIDSSKAGAIDKFSAETQAKEDQGAGSKTVSFGELPPQRKAPIKPVISPVQTGLLGPSTQEIPSGSPVPGQKERQRIVLNFEKADIAEVTNQIFSDQLKLNYVMDQTIQGRISMYIEGDFENDELLQMVTRAYEANGISIIPKKGFYFIQVAQKTGGSGLPVANAQLLKDEKGSRPLIVIYRLRFMEHKQAINLLTPFLTPGRRIISDPLTNSLIFVEDTDNARVLINLLKTIDINVLQEVSMEIIPLSSIAPQDAVQGMESLMSKLGGFKESAIKNSLALIPLNNYRGVLVMAQNPELLKSARQWIQALDVRGLGTQEEIYVYFLQNGLARDIAQIVSSVLGIGGSGGMGQQIVPSGRTATGSALGTTGGGASPFGGGGGPFGSGTSGSTSLAGASGPVGGVGSTGSVSGSSFGGTSSRASSAGAAKTGATTTGATSGPPKPGGIFTGEVMVIPDEVNNAIVVRANAVDYGKIKKTIETLDIVPRAVLIEVLVAEVDLTKDFAYGVQYWYQTHPSTGAGASLSFGGLSNATTTNTSATPSSASSIGNIISQTIGTVATLPTGGTGLGLGWVANSQNIAALLSAVASKTNTRVLSAPTLLATDNTAATMTVGGSVPVPTGSVTGLTTGGEVVNTIQYAEVGVILNITPHINAGGLVRLELEQTIRNVNPTPATVGNQNTAPTFTERNIKTTLLSQNGSTVVIGGIILSQNTVGKTGIPYLQDIPLFSPLFSTKSTDLTRTELLVAITPHVIDQRGSESTRELLEKLHSLKQQTGL